jgi:hypothetical protein
MLREETSLQRRNAQVLPSLESAAQPSDSADLAPVTLVSSTGEEFSAPAALINESETLREILRPEHNFVEARTKVIRLPIKTRYLKRIIEYLQYKRDYCKNMGKVPDFAVSEEETLDLLEVASYLRI